MYLTRAISSIYNSALTLIYPQACLVCGNSVDDRCYGFVCRSCWSATRSFKGPEVICWACGRRSVAVGQESRCSKCDQPLSFVHGCGLYEGALRQAVLSLKREPFIPPHLVDLLRHASLQIPINCCTRIVPVPLHPKRLEARGFNQAELIAMHISLARKIPLDTVSLIRTVHTERHRAGMDAKARRQTVADAFEVQHSRLIAGETVLLVDDVFTSGSTATACARVLLQAGAKEVFVLTVARTS